MKFVSTRGNAPALSFMPAFAAGLAPDGGLYVPDSLPSIAPLLGHAEPGYPDLAFRFFSLFDTDHSPAHLRALVERAHRSFDDPANAAPLRRLDGDTWLLELFHGPTLAFKDFGLQLVGNLFEDHIAAAGNPVNVLGATSGDTGSAAIHGLANKAGVNVFILYPKGRISPLQERQMTCTGAPNIFPIPIEGSFDDGQRIVKTLFEDLDFKARVRLSAVNSINIARILAQSVYYIAAYLRFKAANPGAPDPSFVVPTGNFGNIFAGWLAHKMGLPARRFVIATNRNDILYRLFTSGAYQPHQVHPSHAPSMDIQVASNFERFLYYFTGRDPAATRHFMGRLRSEPALDIPNFDPDVFTATRTPDDQILANIQSVHSRWGETVDPHTACGFTALPSDAPNIVLATAHPAKFPAVIEQAIGQHPVHPVLEALKAKTPVTCPVDATPGAVRDLILQNAAT